jgi:hypothetical protein
MHAGIRFRSRLEARWAAFFDEVGWVWEYEPFDLTGYIPDFLISYIKAGRGGPNTPFLVEVGPCVTLEDYIDKGFKARNTETPYPVLVVGASPLIELEQTGDDPAVGVWSSGHPCRVATASRVAAHEAWATAINTTQWRR